MHLWIRRSLIVLTTFALIFGGFGRVGFAIAPNEPCHSGAHHPVSEMAEHDLGHHGGHDHHQRASDDDAVPEPTKQTADACFKCCGICTISPNLTVRVAAEIIPVSFAISYSVILENYTDRAVVLDPGIPKRIA